MGFALALWQSEFLQLERIVLATGLIKNSFHKKCALVVAAGDCGAHFFYNFPWPLACGLPPRVRPRPSAARGRHLERPSNP